MACNHLTAQEGVVACLNPQQQWPLEPSELDRWGIDQVGGQAHVAVTDVTQADQVATMVETTLRHFGHVDVLVNNAGELLLKPLRQVPLRRFGEANEVAQWVAYLSSDAARFITGQTIAMDGGQIIA